MVLIISASIIDLLRLSAVPVFVWAAVADFKTRRVSRRLWHPMLGLGATLLLWDGLHLWAQGQVFEFFLLKTVVGIVLVTGLVVGGYFIGGIGKADAKAFLTIAVLFPTYPVYELGGITLPVVTPSIGIFSLSILTNVVLIASAYPLLLALENVRRGEFSPLAFVARPVSVTSLDERYGTLLDTDGSFAHSGLDLDALRMYLQWREIDLTPLCSLPGPENRDGPIDDHWQAKKFFKDIETSAYGTTPEELRHGLNRIVATDRVWVAPGIPYLVPTAVGLLLALFVGDIFYLLLETIF